VHERYKTVRNSLLFSSLLFLSILCLSCSNSFNEPVREYHEYWTETCQVGKIEYASEHVLLGGIPNLSASDYVEINLYAINPKGMHLMCRADGEKNFKLENEDGVVLQGGDYSESFVDSTHIRIRARLSDEYEGCKWTLSGCLWPENRTSFTESNLKEQNPELFYSATFKQNTPPDRARDLTHPEEPENDGYHCLHFKYPDQRFNRNKNDRLTYHVECYIREGDSYKFVASRDLTAADSKTSSATEFTYYFDEQIPSLQYDYAVTVVNNTGLKSEKVATAKGLGTCYTMEPTITFGDNGEVNGLTAEKDGNSYEVWEYTGSSFSFTAQNNSDGATMEVNVNGTKTTGDSQTITLANVSNPEGFYDISVTASKNLSVPITVTKRVYVVKTQEEPTLRFYYDGNFPMTLSPDPPAESGYSNYACYILPLTASGTGSAYFEFTPGTGERFTVKINGTEEAADSSGKRYIENLGAYTLTLEAEKDYCTKKTFTKKVYVQGGLRDPTITFENAATNENASDGLPIYRFSYLKSDKMAFTVSPGNTGNTVKVFINDVEKESSDWKLSAGNKYKITVKQSRNKCASPQAYEKELWVYIKPVTVKFKNNKIVFRGDDDEDGSGIDLRGKICAETDDTSAKTLWENGGEWGIGNSKDVDINFTEVSLKLNSPGDKFYIWTGDMYDVDTALKGGKNDWLGRIDKGKKSASYRTLTALKTNKKFEKVYGDTKSKEEGDWFNLTFELVLTDN